MTDIIERDNKTGRFLAGDSGNGGRKPGSRNRLGEQFIVDLRDAWNEHGATALARCAVEEPAAFVRVVASLMPKDVNLSVSVDAASFAEKFRAAHELLGNPEPAKLPRSLRVIDHARNR